MILLLSSFPSCSILFLFIFALHLDFVCTLPVLLFPVSSLLYIYYSCFLSLFPQFCFLCPFLFYHYYYVKLSLHVFVSVHLTFPLYYFDLLLYIFSFCTFLLFYNFSIFFVILVYGKYFFPVLFIFIQ